MEFGSIRQGEPENSNNLTMNNSNRGNEDNLDHIEFNLECFKSAS